MLIIFLLCAFRSGTDRYYLKKARGEKADGKDLLFYLRPVNILSLIGFYLNYWARRFSVAAVCFFPCILTVITALFYLRSRGASLYVSLVLLFGVIIFAVNGLFYFIRLNSFLFLSRYCFSSGRFTSFSSLFRFAVSRMEGKRGEVLRKKLGFIGWFLTCVLVFPVSFVRSYYMETMAYLANELMAD